MEYLPPVDYQKEVHFAPVPSDVEKIYKEGTYLRTSHAYEDLDAGTPSATDQCDNPYVTCDVVTNPDGTFSLTVLIDGHAQVDWNGVCSSVAKKTGFDLSNPDCPVWFSGGSNGWGSTTESGLTFVPEKIVYDAGQSGNYNLPNGDTMNLMVVAEGINENATETEAAAANALPASPSEQSQNSQTQKGNNLTGIGILAGFIVLAGGGIAWIWYKNAPGYVADERREQKARAAEAAAKEIEYRNSTQKAIQGKLQAIIDNVAYINPGKWGAIHRDFLTQAVEGTDVYVQGVLNQMQKSGLDINTCSRGEAINATKAYMEGKIQSAPKFDKNGKLQK